MRMPRGTVAACPTCRITNRAAGKRSAGRFSLAFLQIRQPNRSGYGDSVTLLRTEAYMNMTCKPCPPSLAVYENVLKTFDKLDEVNPAELIISNEPDTATLIPNV